MKSATDNSYWNNFTQTQYDILAFGTDGFIARIGRDLTVDTKAKTHLENARLRDMSVSGYWWVDPTVDKVRQTALIVETAKKFSLPSVILDLEQYWRDWVAYMRGDYVTAFSTRFTPQQLDGYYHYICYEVKNRLESYGIKVCSYSAPWFIDKYAPNLNVWVDGYNYIEAAYLRYTNPAGLAGMYSKFGKPLDISRIEDFKAIAPITRGIGRQWESLLYVKGLYEHQDYMFFTDAGFNTVFGMNIDEDDPVVIIPPVTTKTYIVNTWALNIRSGAGVNYSWVGSYLKGAKVSVFDISGDWGKTEKGWINLTYTLPIQGSYMVNTVWLNIRQSAFATSAIVGGLKFGDIVYELDRSGVWINIGKGWVNSGYLKPV
jgi:uncharacterized protein YgiM (DUF1202 family)